MAAHGSIEAEARAYLHDALCLLYDLADREVTGRALPRAGERRARLESELWRRVHVQIARQMARDRRCGVSSAPDRFTTFHWQSFRRLRIDIVRGRPITEDRQRVVEALVRLGEPEHVLPDGLRRALEKTAARLWLAGVRRAGDGGSGRRELVDEISGRARQDLAFLDHGVPGTSRVSLRDVYVRRGTEERLARVLQQQVLAGSPGQPVQVVLGEAGTGKSSLLWYVADLLDGRRAAAPLSGTRTRPPSDELRAGVALQPVLLRAEQLLTPGEGAQLWEAFELSVKPGQVALLDTADLLLHAGDGRGMLRRAVTVCQERGVPLVLTCRTRDGSALQEILDRTPSDVVLHVGDFRGSEELKRALSTYCLHYLPERSPAARAETVAALLEAAVRGLPVREVVARPLTLRMLFEVYAPQSPMPEIDAAGLYERYWERRVRQDARHGSAAEAVPESADLSWPAQSLARLMLHDGVVALPLGEAADRMCGANPAAGRGDPLEHLVQLDRRSVVAGAFGRPAAVHFFHQTLFEYAAGRCLVQLAEEKKQSYYKALGRHLADHPDDYLRAVVAEQALVQGMRAKGRARDDAADLLCELLESDEADLQVIAVRACALLPDDLYSDVREVFHEYLREDASPAMSREVLALLPTREHSDPARVAEDLAVVLGRGTGMQSRVLDVLCRFARIDRRTSDIVRRSLLRGLCENRHQCVEREPDHEDAAPGGCGGERCLWSWLVNLDVNSAGSHGNQAVRLIDAMAEHQGEWATRRMRELLALAGLHRSRLQTLQCVAVIHRRAEDPDWEALFPVAAGIAQRLGTGVARTLPPAEADDEQAGTDGHWGPRTPAEEWAQAQAALDAYWYAAATSGRSPREVIRALAEEGKTPFGVPKARLRAVLGQVGTLLREATEGVPELLEETVALCRGRDTVDDVSAFLLPPLLREPADDPGTRAAAAWCADRLGVLDPRADPGRRPPSPALRFAVTGLAGVPPVRLAGIVPWPSQGRPWGDRRSDDTFLALDGATRLVVPLAATGHAKAVLALERWRTLEGLRHDQLARGRNAWPTFRGGDVYHGSRARDRMSALIQTALADHAPQAHRMVLDALRFRVPTADIPWLAALAKRTVEQPGPPADPACALFDRFGPELAGWCADLWDTGRCPDAIVKLAALRLWGDLVRMGAADRPSLAVQTELAARVRNRQWTTACQVMRHWNGHDLSSVAAVGGEPGWEGLDAVLATADVPGSSSEEIALLRSFLRCRFAPLSTEDAVVAAVDVVAEQVRHASGTATIHDSGAGFLAERLCAIDPGRAVAVTLEVARRTAGAGMTDPHHVTRLGWKWQKPLTRIAATADRADWLRLIGGLADGPRSMLQKALDTAAARRLDEDVRADAAQELAASPYRDVAMAGLRDAGVRHRRTPLEERLWPEVLQPAEIC